MPPRWLRNLRQAWATDPAHPFRDLHLSGVAGIALYIYAIHFFTHFPITEVAIYEVFSWPLVLGLLAAFAVGYRAIRFIPESPRLRRVVAGYAFALTLVAALVPAFHSTDLYVYVNIGWQQAGYGVNPFQVLLYEMPKGLTDPMFYPQWQFVPCSYGFLFALETRAACAISGPDNGIAVLVLKTIAAACFLTLGFVVWVGGRALGRPDPIRGAFLVLWNPLLLLHCVSNAHNDLQFGLGVAVAVVGFARGRWLIVFPALATASLIKYISVVLVPFFLLASVRRFGWWRTGASCAAGLGLAAACWWPYHDGFDATYFSRMGANLTMIHTSVASMVVWPYDVVVRPHPPLTPNQQLFFQTLKLVCWGAFAAFAGVQLLGRMRRGGTSADLARDTVLILLAVIVASPKYHTWYLAMFLPLAVWLPLGSRLRQVVMAMGIANLLSFTFVYHAGLIDALFLLVLPVGLVLRNARRPAIAPPAPRTSDPLAPSMKQAGLPHSRWRT